MRTPSKRERKAMVIPPGHGPIPRILMLNKAHNDTEGIPRPHPEKREVKGLGEGRREGGFGGGIDKHEVVQHTLTQGGGIGLGKIM